MTVGMVRNAHFLVIARSETTWQSIFQVVQDLRWIASPSARNDGGAARNAHFLVIARSETTWQSIFQTVQDSRWIASPPARNDGEDTLVCFYVRYSVQFTFSKNFRSLK